jgi:hypothetical protein
MTNKIDNVATLQLFEILDKLTAETPKPFG